MGVWYGAGRAQAKIAACNAKRIWNKIHPGCNQGKWDRRIWTRKASCNIYIRNTVPNLKSRVCLLQSVAIWVLNHQKCVWSGPVWEDAEIWVQKVAEGGRWAKPRTSSFLHKSCNYSHITSSNWPNLASNWCWLYKLPEHVLRFRQIANICKEYNSYSCISSMPFTTRCTLVIEASVWVLLTPWGPQFESGRTRCSGHNRPIVLFLQAVM